MSLGLIQKSSRAFGARTMKACVARSHPRVMRLKLKVVCCVDSLILGIAQAEPDDTLNTMKNLGLGFELISSQTDYEIAEL